MATSNPYIVRFTVGKSYRLRTSPDLPNSRSGFITIRAELYPRDQWGNRILLADAHLDGLSPNDAPTNLLGARCFVEEGFAEERDAYGVRTIPVEIATLQGVYPHFAKSYANADISVAQRGFTPMLVQRTVA